MSRVFSGVQPTGEGPHIGNYIGAFRQWVALQDVHESLICVVNLHSMTVDWDPAALAGRTRNTVASLLACGIDPARTTLFVQSDVREHTELSWILTCLARTGELERMTQFKDKTRGKEAGSIGAGILMYPVLMAADVLAYRADLVPVGEDQRQHLELMRDLAERFDRAFGETFPVPQALIPQQGARIMSLDDPTKKMSKSSERPNSSILMLDDASTVKKKIARAVTDSGREVVYSSEKPAVANLLDIFAAVSGRSVEDLVEEFAGKGYAELKSRLTDSVVAFLRPFQERYLAVTGDPGGLDAAIERGAERARSLAAATLASVRERTGLDPLRL